MKFIKTCCLSIMFIIAVVAISLQQVPAQDAGISTTSSAPKSAPTTMPVNDKTVTTNQSAVSQPTNNDQLASPEKLLEAIIHATNATVGVKAPSDPQTRPDWNSLTTLQKNELLAQYKKECQEFEAAKAASSAAAEQKFIGKPVQWILILDDVQADNPGYKLSLRSDSGFLINFTVPETDKQNALALHKGDYVVIDGAIEKLTLKHNKPPVKDIFNAALPEFNIAITNAKFSVSTREAFLATVPATSEVSFLGSKTAKADAVIYVIDRSGSMMESFDALKAEMTRSITSLSDRQEFHIMFYSSGNPLEMEPSGLKQATEENKLKAVKFIRSISVEGNTNPVPAMEKALTLLSASKKTNKTIYLLTDGKFDNPPLVINTIKQKNIGDPKSLINTLFYGDAPSKDVEEVLQDIANDSGGRYMHVESSVPSRAGTQNTNPVPTPIPSPVSTPAAKHYADADVAKAITKAREYLWSKYKDSTGEPCWPAGNHIYTRNYPVGFNAMIAYALLISRDKLDDSDSGKKLKKAVDWIATATTEKMGAGATTDIPPHTYSTALRLQLLSILPESYSVERIVQKKMVKSSKKELIAEDFIRLVKSMKMATPITDIRRIAIPKDITTMDVNGGWSYECAGDFKSYRSIDQSNTHFGFMGVHSAAKAYPELASKELWSVLYLHYLASQSDGGWWAYMCKKESEWPSNYYPANMTSAGIANMLIASEYLFADKFVACGAKDMDTMNKKIDMGFEWIAGQINPDTGLFKTNCNQITGYSAYAMGRAGAASGYKFFGDKDWRRISVKTMLKTQGQDGSWLVDRSFYDGSSAEIRTAFNLIFLVHSRSPAIMSRLSYDGDWNNRPHAMGRLSRWASGKEGFDAEIGWQIVPITTPSEQWLDSPALLISGSADPKFSADNEKKLADFVSQGGTIVAVAEGNGAAFNNAMKAMYAKIFPKYQLQKIDDKHPLATCRTIKGKLPLMSEITNGIRPIVIHIETDIIKDWQANATVPGKLSFDIAANIATYLNGGKSLRNRGESPWPVKPQTWPERKVQLARLACGDDIEPMAWERMRWKLADDGIALEIAPATVAIKDLPAAKANIATLCGNDELKLQDSDAAAIKSFVEGGGLLIVDALGGSKKFEESAKKVLGEIFGGADKLQLLPADSPLLAAMPKEFKIAYRPGASRGEGNSTRLLAITVNGKVGVVFSGDDLTEGVLGVTAMTIDGYTADSAYNIARAMIMSVAEKVCPARPTSIPEQYIGIGTSGNF